MREWTLALSSGDDRGWRKGYIAAQLLFWMGYGVYYTYSRMYIEETRGQDYGFASLIAAAEVTPLLFSVLMGYAADRLGRRRMIILGLGQSLSTIAMGLLPLPYLPLLSGLGALFYSIAYSAFLGAMLTGVAGSGYEYSLIAAAGSVGWGLGGVSAGVLHSLGTQAAFGMAGLLMMTAYLTAYASTPSHLEASRTPVPKELKEAMAGILHLFLSITLGGAGLTLFFTSSSLKLKAEIGNPILYGIVFSTITSLMSAAIRPFAGRLSDNIGHVRLLAISTALYIPMALGILEAHGYLLAVIWVIPLFPFRDVALSMSISTGLPRSLQATAAGVIAFASSIGGFIVLLTYPLIAGGTLDKVFLVMASLLAVSLALLYPYMKSKPV